MTDYAGLTDTHCHLGHEQFDQDRTEVVDRARAAGLTRLLVIGYDLASSRAAVQLAADNTDMQPVIGIHPEAAHEWSKQARAELTALATSERSRVAAWGEIGLDYHWESVPRVDQQRVFEEQLNCARSLDLPVVIHCRDAYPDVISTLERLEFSRAVLHCFVGTPDDAARAQQLGVYFGVGGIATFKRSDELRAILAELPLSRLILETDCPYLAPQAWRGRRNEPAYITAVADVLAEVRGLSVEAIIQQTSSNADALFGRME